MSRFAAVLPVRYDLESTLTEFTESVALVLRVFGSGITMADDPRLRYLTKALQTSAEVERDQIHRHQCPSRDAYATGEVVAVTDLREESTRWPEFSASARPLNVVGLAAVSMRLDDKIIGTLNLYSSEPREWSDRDIAVTGVLADVATSNVVNASMRLQQEQLSQQLQEALDSRVVIEQAKGITAQQHSFTVDAAYQLMRGHARNNNASLRLVAEAIVAVGLHV